MKTPNCFLISVSNRNLELCMKYALAGFTNSLMDIFRYRRGRLYLLPLWSKSEKPNIK